MAIYDVTDLNVYNRSLLALKLVYKLAYQLPETHFKLKKQIISSAESIPPFTHARAILILFQIRNFDKTLCQKIIDEYKIISKQLTKLHKNWKNYSLKNETT